MSAINELPPQEQGEIKPCIAASLFELLENDRQNHELEDMIINVTGVMYSGKRKFRLLSPYIP